ncbi:MAG: hypothetical protein GXO50_08485 [Chlorobi bacterium]|nr:hypothetical protein [Chlorobiota bacterium]
MTKTKLTGALNISLPFIMAPMFLVSDENMVKAAVKNQIAGTFPTLNYRKPEQLNSVLKNLNRIHQKTKKSRNIRSKYNNPKIKSLLQNTP